MISLSQEISSDEETVEPRERHIGVFLPSPGSLFFDEVREGAEAVAQECNAALSFHSISTDNPEFVFARYSGIDGAIVYPYGDEVVMRRRLDELEKSEIPVVLIERGVASDWPFTFVGTNNFNMGRRIGALVDSLFEGPVKLTVVYSDKSPGAASEKELVELGITTVLGERLAAPVERRQTGLNPLDAEALTYQLLRNDSELTVLVFTDTNDTLAAMQVIVDLNLVGRVQVVGFGMTDMIRDYLDQEVMAASIVVKPQVIGSQAVKVMTELLRDGYLAGYIDTGFDIVQGRNK